MTGQPRPIRVDAQRNLEKLLIAAREAVSEVGIDVTAHEIARRAGVGIGTFYRRVGSREALLHEVLAELINDAVRDADQTLADPDAWHGFSTLAERLVRLRADSRGVAAALGGQCGGALDQPLAALRDRIRRVVERAQQAAVLRPDLSWREVPFILAAVSTDDQTLGLVAEPNQWRRNLTIILDGLRYRNPSI